MTIHAEQGNSPQQKTRGEIPSYNPALLTFEENTQIERFFWVNFGGKKTITSRLGIEYNVDPEKTLLTLRKLGVMQKVDYKKMLNFCYSLYPKDPEDIVQHGVLKANLCAYQFHGNDTMLQGWVKKIFTNRALDLHRRSGRESSESECELTRQVVPGGYEGDNRFDDRESIRAIEYIPDPSSDIEEQIVGQEFVDDVTRAVQALPVKHRETTRLSLDERTYDDISGQLGLSIGTVKSRRSRGVAILRKDPTILLYKNK